MFDSGFMPCFIPGLESHKLVRVTLCDVSTIGKTTVLICTFDNKCFLQHVMNIRQYYVISVT